MRARHPEFNQSAEQAEIRSSHGQRYRDKLLICLEEFGNRELDGRSRLGFFARDDDKPVIAAPDKVTMNFKCSEIYAGLE